MNEVDEIVSAWQREVPGLDVSALRVFSRVDRLAVELATRRRTALAGHSLAQHEFDVLAALRRAGAPYELTAGALSEATHVTTGTMTNRLDGLAERRLVRRTASGTDRRVTLVRLTAAGRRRVDAALGALVQAERELLRGSNRTAQRQLAAALQQILDVAGSTAAPG